MYIYSGSNSTLRLRIPRDHRTEDGFKLCVRVPWPPCRRNSVSVIFCRSSGFESITTVVIFFFRTFLPCRAGRPRPDASGFPILARQLEEDARPIAIIFSPSRLPTVKRTVQFPFVEFRTAAAVRAICSEFLPSPGRTVGSVRNEQPGLFPAPASCA
jgi:hypothetical protein